MFGCLSVLVLFFKCVPPPALSVQHPLRYRCRSSGWAYLDMDKKERESGRVEWKVEEEEEEEEEEGEEFYLGGGRRRRRGETKKKEVWK